MTEFTCQRRQASITYTSYLVFSAIPSASTVALKLLGAPDGDDVFTPFDEP